MQKCSINNAFEEMHYLFSASFKGVLLCSFTKSCLCFGGVLEHALMRGGSKIALFFT